jgi:hypothetical protein
VNFKYGNALGDVKLMSMGRMVWGLGAFIFSRFFFLLVRCLSCILLVYLGCVFVPFNEFAFSYKIKKKDQFHLVRN